MHPKEIFPQTECCHSPKDQSPDHSSQRQFGPNPATNALASNRRRRTEKGSQENKRAIKQSEIQLKKCGQTSLPPWNVRMGKRPKFPITFCREIGMMRLMNHTVETEAHQAQGANHHPIELIEATIFSEKPVSRLMQADEEAVHQMADHEHERHRQPDPAAIDRHREHHFSENQTQNEKLERTPQDPMRLMHLTKVFIDGGFVHWGWFNTSEIRLSGERQIPTSTRRNMPSRLSMSRWENRFS